MDCTLKFDIREVDGGTLRISWYPEVGDVRAALRVLGSVLYRDESGAVIACLRLKGKAKEFPAHYIAHISGPVLAGLAQPQMTRPRGSN